ncbi:MAG: methyltransferase [Planctomycetota bacterium]|nr:methyltransferase [Planctomycetota bacterium]
MLRAFEFAGGIGVEVEAPDAPDEAVRLAESRGSAEGGYWAAVWPAAEVLGECLATSVLVGPGVRVLEIGCGVGLAGLVAAARGAEVVLSDIDERAVELAGSNLRRNGLSGRAVVLDWRDDGWPAALAGWEPDLIVGSDVLYFERAHGPIARLIARAGCPAILADPNRPRASGAVEVFERMGLACWVRAVSGGRMLMVQRGRGAGEAGGVYSLGLSAQP